MKATENLYHSIENTISEETSTFKITLNSEHPIFEGHFPEKSIVPGVVQLEIIRELLSLSVRKEVKLKTMNNCKYLAFIEPQSCGELLIKLNFSKKEEDYAVNTTISNETTSFLKMKGVFG